MATGNRATKKKIGKALTVATCAALACAASFTFFGCSTKIKGISLSTDELTLVWSENENEIEIGHIEADLDMKGTYEYNNYVTWESADESVATVQSGIVTPVGKGKTVITATVGDYSASCDVTVKAGTLKVGVKEDVYGFGYYNSYYGRFEGLEVDIGGLLADSMMYADVRYVPLESSQRLDALNSGEVDCVIATYSITFSRLSEVNFSSSYYTDYIRVLANLNYLNSYGVTSLSELSSYLADISVKQMQNHTIGVGVVEGTTAREEFTSYCAEADITTTSEDFSADADGPREIFEFTEYENYEDAAEALTEGEIDLFLGDYSILRTYQTKTMKFMDDKFGPQDYGVATRLAGADDDESSTAEANLFTETVNGLIDEWLEDGVMDGLIDKWGLEDDAATSLSAKASSYEDRTAEKVIVETYSPKTCFVKKKKG